MVVHKLRETQIGFPEARTKNWNGGGCLLLLTSKLLEHILWGGHFWKYKPPGGLPETNPGFSETQISAKCQGLKTVWSIYFSDF